MAIQTIVGGLYIPSSFAYNGNAPAFQSFSGGMTVTGAQRAFIFQVPKTGTLDWFETRQNANTDNPDNGVRFSFQDLDASGNPDNTEDQFRVITAGFGTPAWLVPPGVMTNDGTNGGSKRSVTKGDWLACVVRFESFVAGDSIQLSETVLSSGAGVSGRLNSYQDISANAGTTWAKASNGLVIALKYDDGTYAVIPFPDGPFLNINTRTYNSGSAADERGLLFQVPFPARLAGVCGRFDIDAAMDLVLYDAASSVIATITLGAANRASIAALNGSFLFPSPPTLVENVNYRLAVKPTTVTGITIYDFDVNASAILPFVEGGATWMSTNRVDAGSWTDVNTNRPFIGLILDGFDDAAGSGGGEHSNVF